MLALLPTATDNILEALPVESITQELQQKKAERLARTAGTATDAAATTAAAAPATSDFSSGAPSISAATATDEDGRSLQSFSQSESGFVHASQQLTEGATTKRKTKAQLWDELKINAITRVFTLIYTLSLLTLLTRIQLNLLGRRNYLSSVVTLASHTISSQQPPSSTSAAQSSSIQLENRDEDAATYLSRASYGNDFETNRQYLTFSWWLLHRGWHRLMLQIRTAVEETFGPLNPREDVSLAQLSELTLAIRRKVEGATAAERNDKRRWLPYLLPPAEEEAFVLSQSGGDSPASPHSPALRRLLDETSDLLTSPHASHVLTLLFDAAFTLLIDTQIATQCYNLRDPAAEASSTGSRIEELPDTALLKTKLASVLAGMTRAAHAVGGTTLAPNTSAAAVSAPDAAADETMKNVYLEKIEEVGELGGLSAVVFSANWGAEGVEEEHAAVPEATPATAADSTSGFESAWGKATVKRNL